MIEYNKPASGNDDFFEQNRTIGVQNEATAKMPLTQLWEVIVRQKRLPEGFDADALYAVVREKLRDPEREVRQHALRVLVDLIPVTQTLALDEHMRGLIPELLTNLSHSAPALRKSALDSLRKYIRHSKCNEDLLMELINSDEDNVVGAVAFLVSSDTKTEILETIINRLWDNLTNPRLNQETVAKSLARIRYVLGDERFKNLIGLKRYEELQEICDKYGLPIDYSDADSDKTFSNGDESVEDRVILETEITLKTGPAITMKIHEESRSNSVSGDSEEELRPKVCAVKVIDDDSESDFYDSARRTPRKVRFGGECVKMRTPESDSSQPDDENSEITITVTDVVSIKTRKSLIPIRITSLPSTPRKTHLTSNKGRLHRSAPNLSLIGGKSKIPLKKNSTILVRAGSINSDVDIKNASSPTSPIPKRNKAEDLLTPRPHNEIEVLHNLTRSPERKSNQASAAEHQAFNSFQIYQKPGILALPAPSTDKSDEEIEGNNNFDSFQMCPEDQRILALPSSGKSLTPEPEQNTFNSFQVYSQENNDLPAGPVSLPLAFPLNSFDNKDDSITVMQDKEGKRENLLRMQDDSSFDQQYDISSFSTEDNFFNKSEALDNLLNMLKQPNTCESLESGPASLLFEALFACQHLDKLHFLADDALKLMIKGLRVNVLEQCLGRLAMGICKIGAPSGVTLALMIMKRCSAKKLQNEIVERCSSHRTREGALQVLMAAARLLPSSDVEVVRITEFASGALRDRRRKVRHAALETLATLAQISSNGDVLDIVTKVTGECQDHQHLNRVVRTRLSRRQLPTVELDGTVRYSTPRERAEVEWLSGSNPTSSTPSSSASSSNHSVNYWIRNSRHDGNNRPEGYFLTSNEDENVGNGQQIWAVDPSVISKIGNIKSNGKGHAVFRPVYILQPEPITIPPHQGGGRGHRRFDRGRSFSPPKHYPRSYQEPSIRPDPSPVAGSASAMQFPQASSIPRKFRFNEGFRKSFSSEHLYMAEKSTGQQQEGYFSLSSRSSTTSTGSSTKSGLWQRDIRSGIPIPIQPDSKHRTRHSNNINTTKGPVIARRNGKVVDVNSLSKRSTPVLAITLPPETSEKSVLASPIESPAITRISPRENGHVEPVLPPNSSGSESSGYFTPRLSDSRQAFVKLNTEDHSSESEEPETQNDKNNNNEDCVDSFNNNSEYVVDNNLQINEIISLTSSAEASDVNEDLNDNKIDNLSLKSIVSEKEDLIPLRFSASSDPKEKDFNENASSARSKSKSVVDLQNFLPEIVSRKSSNSAPPLKDDVVSNSSLVITNLDEPPLSASRVDLDETEPPLQLEETETTVVEITTRKLTRRLSRTQSKRSIKSTPRKVQETTPKSSRSTQNKPKETIQQALAQLNNPEWEVMILGLQSLSKIIKTHPDVVESQMHTVCGNLARHIKNLRSQVARAACHTTAELFAHCRKGLDMELEEIAGPLLHRTADTNKFLRADANEALDVMCDHLPLHRIISVITSRGATHQNSVVRSTATRLIRDIVKKIGADKVFQLQKESREKIFLTGANALTDGSPEARSNGKSLFSYLMAHPNFQRTLLEVVPQSTIRHIAKTLNTIKPNSST